MSPLTLTSLQPLEGRQRLVQLRQLIDSSDLNVAIGAQVGDVLSAQRDGRITRGAFDDWRWRVWWQVFRCCHAGRNTTSGLCCAPASVAGARARPNAHTRHNHVRTA
jgi:hypothetical protein